MSPASPDELRTEADKADAEASELERQARVRRDQARILRLAARDLDRLTGGLQTATVNDMDHAHRAALSRASGSDEFLQSVRLAGYDSLRDLAKAMKCSATFLSAVRAGRRTMPPNRAEQIEALTGYRRENWPRKR